MKIWGRAQSGWRCGCCGAPFAQDAWVCYLTLPGLRPKRRCVACADEPVPPFPPPPTRPYHALTIVDADGIERPAVPAMTSIRELLTKTVLDFKQKASGE